MHIGCEPCTESVTLSRSEGYFRGEGGASVAGVLQHSRHLGSQAAAVPQQLSLARLARSSWVWHSTLSFYIIYMYTSMFEWLQSMGLPIPFAWLVAEHGRVSILPACQAYSGWLVKRVDL
jgi:hypothetical protein